MTKRETWVLETNGRGLYEISERVARLVAQAEIDEGDVDLFCRHTSCSLIYGENADPSVQRDLDAFFARLVPDGDLLFEHRAEGPDDMAAHLRTVLTTSELRLPIMGGRPALGTWQGVFLWEHRTAPHRREIIATARPL